MVDFVVGRPAGIGQTRGDAQGETRFVEAQVLHVRAPRGRRQGSGESSESRGEKERRRGARKSSDPPGSRVLVLLVSDAHRLPNDLADGGYRVFLRFAKS